MPNARILAALALFALVARADDPDSASGPAAAPGPDAGFSIEKGGHAFVTTTGKIAVVVGQDPSLYLELDREYGVVKVRIKGAPDSYNLVPLDDQSALGLIPGGAQHVSTDAELAKLPGFGHLGERGADIGGRRVRWREWTDANHFFADCTAAVQLPSGQTYDVYLRITANSAKRRESLEASVATLRPAGPQDVPMASVTDS